METVNHYDTLGVAQAAELPVIRAAYKALALIHHPDKTVHLSREDRAAHAELFRNIREAFDVLSNPASKSAYDRELERRGNRVDTPRSFFRRLSTPEEKRMLKARIEQDLAYLREQRAKRDVEDSKMDIAGLKFMLQTWKEMALEYDDDALGHGNLRTHCATQIQVYQAKIEQRQRDQEDWLKGMSRPKTPDTSGMEFTRHPPRQSTTSNPSRLRTTVSPSNPAPHASHNKPAAGPAPPVSLAYAKEQALKKAVRQARLDAKAAAVRAEKEKMRTAREEQAREEAARHARARAKAGVSAPGKRSARDDAYTSPQNARESRSAATSSRKGPCSTCGQIHASFADFRKCVKEYAGQNNDDSFFQTV